MNKKILAFIYDREKFLRNNPNILSAADFKMLTRSGFRSDMVLIAYKFL